MPVDNVNAGHSQLCPSSYAWSMGNFEIQIYSSIKKNAYVYGHICECGHGHLREYFHGHICKYIFIKIFTAFKKLFSVSGNQFLLQFIANLIEWMKTLHLWNILWRLSKRHFKFDNLHFTSIKYHFRGKNLLHSGTFFSFKNKNKDNFNSKNVNVTNELSTLPFFFLYFYSMKGKKCWNSSWWQRWKIDLKNYHGWTGLF